MTRRILVILLLSATTAAADTIYLRNGQRLRGEVRSIRNGVVEFEEDRGFRNTRTMRIDREDVARIDFDEVEPVQSSATPGGRPSGMRERDITVASNVAWTDTGVDVRSGQSVYFSANGRVRWGPGRQDGPAGESGSPRNASRPIASRPAAGLIGKIGDSNDFFFIGDDTAAIRMRSSGRLYLGINDDFLQDNSGSFRVVVYY